MARLKRVLSTDGTTEPEKKRTFVRHSDGTISIKWGRFAGWAAFWLWLLDTTISAIFASISVFELDAVGHFIHYGGIKLAIMLVLAGIGSWFVNWWIGFIGIIVAAGGRFVLTMCIALFSSRVNTPAQTKAKATPTGQANDA